MINSIINRVNRFKGELGDLYSKLVEDIKALSDGKVLIEAGEDYIEYIFPTGFLPSVGDGIGNSIFGSSIYVNFDKDDPFIEASSVREVDIDEPDFLKLAVADFDQNLLNQINQNLSKLINFDNIGASIDYWGTTRYQRKTLYLINLGSLRADISGKLMPGDVLPKISEIIGKNLNTL